MTEPFERIVDAHGVMVLRVCRALLGPVDADDAWSDTFLAAMVAYPRLTPGSNVAAWLATIARNTSIDHLRARGRVPSPLDRLPEPTTSDPVPVSVDPTLRTALAELTERQRLAVLYHHVAGLAHRDVAELIGGTPASVRRAAADGIARLRRAHHHTDQRADQPADQEGDRR